MCLIAFDWRPGTDRPLVMVANRDEFHARPTEPLHWWAWPEGPLAGRDLQAGGTWMGVRRDGRFAALTNVRDPSADPGERSRGELVAAALTDAPSIEGYMADVHGRRHDYGPFNLLVGSPEQLWQVGSHAAPDRVTPGLHALSNQSLDTPWPKSIRAVQRLERALTDSSPSIETLLGLLDDRTPADDDALPDTGVGRDLERLLSAPFIVDARYGTRSSTVLILESTARMAERVFDPEGRRIGQQLHTWTLS